MPRAQLKTLEAQLNTLILDKETTIRLVLSCFVAGGHLLLEDLPGMGKTTLAHGLAQLLGLDFARIQFTNDMLPADVLGMLIYHPDTQTFTFKKGAIFTHFLLADEINRASPKTQSALLEAMEEHQVTQDGISYALPDPFFVIATQNPASDIGVYPLPQSQLDRFLMCLSLGYPSLKAERELLLGQDRRQMLQTLAPLFDANALKQVQRLASDVYLAPVVLDYLQTLVNETRKGQWGLSPRALLATAAAARAHAFLCGHEEAAIEDIQRVFVACAQHRLGLGVSAQVILDQTPV